MRIILNFVPLKSQKVQKIRTFAANIKQRIMMIDLLSRITIDRNVCNGRPSIRGMRFTVSQMLELVASGMTPDEILNDYSYIEADDITACLHYASQVLNNRNMLLIEEVV